MLNEKGMISQDGKQVHDVDRNYSSYLRDNWTKQVQQEEKGPIGLLKFHCRVSSRTPFFLYKKILNLSELLSCLSDIACYII